MSFHKPSKLQLAVHEAGHAYAFAAARPSEHPLEMGLGRDAAGNARGWSRRRTLLTFGTSLKKGGHSRDRDAATEIYISVAGPLAEFRHRHRSRDSAALLMHSNVDRFLVPDAFDTEGDFDHIRSVMGEFGSIDPHATLRASIDAADFTLAMNWPSIARLGRALFEHEYLGQAYLATWFADHPVRPCPVNLRLIG